MSANDLAALILAAVAVAAVAVLTVVCLRLGRLTAELRQVVDDLRAEARPAVGELVAAADAAAAQVDRLESVINTTAHVADTVDTATQVTFRALANPVIKGAALASGTGRAARRLRGRPGLEDGSRRAGGRGERP